MDRPWRLGARTEYLDISLDPEPGVLARSVVHAADRWVAAECGVAEPASWADWFSTSAPGASDDLLSYLTGCDLAMQQTRQKQRHARSPSATPTDGQRVRRQADGPSA
jgi:hypothetical protein